MNLTCVVTRITPRYDVSGWWMRAGRSKTFAADIFTSIRPLSIRSSVSNIRHGNLAFRTKESGLQ